jgi:hypothetical protein
MDNTQTAAFGVAPSFERYPPLSSLTRSHVDTQQAAFYLNRKSQTLRRWACFEDGPIRPVRVHGRLCWPVEGIRQLLPA